MAMVSHWLTEAASNPQRCADAVELRKRLDRLEAMRRDRPRAVPPVFMHGDLGPHNILVVGTEVSGIVDWTSAGVGDPRVDLAALIAGESDEVLAAFYRGYDMAPVPGKEIEYFRRARDLLWGPL